MNIYLSQKENLTNPKRGDEFQTEFYLEGTRLCNLKVGSKWVYVRSVHGSAMKKFRINEAKQILSSMYWKAARLEEFYSNNFKKPRKGWERKY